MISSCTSKVEILDSILKLENQKKTNFQEKIEKTNDSLNFENSMITIKVYQLDYVIYQRDSLQKIVDSLKLN